MSSSSAVVPVVVEEQKFHDDLFHRLFKKCVVGSESVEDTRTWEEYLNELTTHGLLRINEVENVRKLGIKHISASRKKGLGGSISFQDFQKILVHIGGSVTQDRIDAAVTHVLAQSECYYKLADQWDVDHLDEIQVHQLLTVLNELHTLHQNTLVSINDRQKFQKTLLENQSVYSLFWAPVTKARSCDVSLYVGESPSAVHFQQSNVAAIERVLHKRKVRNVKLMATEQGGDHKRKKKTSSLVQLNDTFGHSKGPRDGIMILKGFTTGNNSTVVQVVAVSKRSTPPARLRDVFNTVSAHRQLALSSAVQHFLGSDSLSSEDDSFYYYEQIDAKSLASLLEQQQKPRVTEDSPLFRQWARGILSAVRAIFQQCTHRIRHRIRAKNVFISSGGLRVLLGGLDFGDPIDVYDGSIHEFHKTRETALISDFARLVHYLLCPTTVPSNRRDFYAHYVTGNYSVLEYSSTKSMSSVINVCIGDKFVLFPPGVGPLCGSNSSFKNMNDGPLVQPSSDDDSILVEKTEEVHRGETMLKAVRSGTCSVFFRRQLPEDTESVVEVVVTVHEVEISPTLRAILRSCVSDGEATSVRTPTLEQLEGHPYFRKSHLDDDEDRALLQYEEDYDDLMLHEDE